MSDREKDLVKCYQENVIDGHHDRRLLPIPEEPRPRPGMWSVALGVLLTTLRYLAPATLLTLFWGQRGFLCRLVKSIDTAFRAIVFSSEDQKQEVLRWLSDAGPVRIQRLDTVWRHGWIVCGVLDTALPGTCAGHAPSRLSLKHAQAIAEHYLGVEPVFSKQELEANDSLSRIQEWKLATYLGRIKQALSQITPPVSKPVSQRTSPETTQNSMAYVAKGAGLTAAQVNNKMYFKIYPASQQSLDPGEITILIRGPKDTYGMSVLPPLLGKSQIIRQQLIGLDTAPTYTENALPITQGATYLRAYGKNDMNKTFHIPKTKYDIEIEATIHSDYIRIGYTVNLEGRHDISITSRGQHIVGSPFVMKSSSNIINTLETDSYSLEDGEEIGIMDIGTDRKVVLRIVDFVTEKMLLRENGSLEKISDDEAEKLLTVKTKPTIENTEVYLRSFSATSKETDLEEKNNKFSRVAKTVIRMNRVCKLFGEMATERKQKDKIYKSSNRQPDIVNSTFNDSVSNSLFLSVSEGDKNSKSTAVTNSEKPNIFLKDSKSKSENLLAVPASELNMNTPDSLEEYKLFESQIDELPRTQSSSPSSNPFLNDVYEQEFEKDLRTFVKSEFETNSSQSEETAQLPIQIVVEEDPSETPTFCSNPYIDPDIITMERPKTPVLKIIKGEVNDRCDSVYVDRKAELFGEELLLVNEFINPLFVHKHQMIEENIPTTDFIIGAPVSLPPIVIAKTPEQDMDSIVLRGHPENSTVTVIDNYINNEDKSLDSINPEFSNSFPLNIGITDVQKLDNRDIISSTFHSIDSSYMDNVSNSSNNTGSCSDHEVTHPNRKVTIPKKDMWDSAYVSIDESTSTPDSNCNNNTSCESTDKMGISPNNDYSKMGPAEKEMWLTCQDLKNNTPTENSNHDIPDLQHKICTPIKEETNWILSTEQKDDNRFPEMNPVPVTFAKLNTTLYLECLRNQPNMDNATYITENNNTRTDFTTQLERRESVDSASGVSDVKRRAKQLEGKISEVQANVTESGSASRTLRQIQNDRQTEFNRENKVLTESSDECHNIVIEKKHYWDERIREIEAKTKQEGCKVKPRRLSARNLIQNDSLTKKRAKEVANNFISSNEKDKRFIKAKSTIPNITGIAKDETIRKTLSEEKLQTESKIVKKWRKYWDTKLELEKDAKASTTNFKSKSPEIKEGSFPSPSHTNNTNRDSVVEYKNPTELKNNKEKSETSPVKEELPEEVFKAFETSPKRFFGTSRKQILNKIDSFLDKPSTAESSSTDASGAIPDTGLVCSRISLFHTISKTEQPSWVRRKCQSMQNISMRKFSESYIYSTDEDVDVKPKYTTGTLSPTLQSNKTINEIKQNISKVMLKDTTQNQHRQTENIPLKEKRARLVQRIYNTNKSLDESLYEKHTNETKVSSVKSAFKEINNNITQVPKLQTNAIRKSTVSKSEMDIFNKVTNTLEDDLDIHKSYEDLPKPCVKNFISLYESVSSSDEKEQSSRRESRCSKKHLTSSSSLGAANKTNSTNNTRNPLISSFQTKTHARENWRNKSLESVSSSSIEPRSLDSTDQDVVPSQQPEKETTYVSFSDIELEIVENPNETELQETEDHTTDYKSRFITAKQYFKSLEVLPPDKPLRKPNECEILLMKSSTESLEIQKPQKQKRTKKNITKSSLPSSEKSYVCNQSQDEGANKLTKISEKFNVEDLFNDVMEGKISRQGSLRGIPHKKAVLEAFRSMESLVPSKISPYDIAVSQINQFAKENHMKTAQSYLNEYPYLPTTDPSKYHSRLDAKAHGLISLKELTNKPRRNSVPDLRLNTTFTVNL